MAQTVIVTVDAQYALTLTTGQLGKIIRDAIAYLGEAQSRRILKGMRGEQIGEARIVKGKALDYIHMRRTLLTKARGEEVS